MAADEDTYVEPATFTIGMAARRLNMSVTTFRSRVLPDLRTIKLSRKTILIPRAELDRWIDRNATRD